MNHRHALITGLVLIAAILQQTAITHAQDTPPLSVAASGFVNPRGFAFDTAGQLIVAEAGVGDESGQSDGPVSAGSTGAISTAQDRCATPLTTDLPSARNTLGETWGPTAIATIGSRVFALISGGGEANGNPEVASGVYELVDGGLLLRADLGNWYTANPVTTPPTESSITGGLWVAMTANSAGDSLLAVEQGAGQLVQVALDGVVSRIADLSADNQAPSAIATGPDGSIYVGYFTAEPYRFQDGNGRAHQLRRNTRSRLDWSHPGHRTGHRRAGRVCTRLKCPAVAMSLRSSYLARAESSARPVQIPAQKS